MSFKEVLFASYSGLRGAVALVLALILTEEEKVPNEVCYLILFHVCGIVFWTLIINGLTAGYLLKYLQLN
jgi:NhaP-type Na+/H+ or K+/H+ antiporter